MFTIFLCISFIIVFAVYSDYCIPAASSAVNQFLTIVLPSLLPFYIAADMLKKTNFSEYLSKFTEKFTKVLFKVSGNSSLVIIIGYISGYPTGAKIACDLYCNGKISYEDTVRLSMFTNNTGPLFLIGTIGVGMLHSAELGIKLLFIHVISSIIAGIFLNNFVSSEQINKTRISFSSEQFIKDSNLYKHKKSFFQDISDSLTNAIFSMLPVGAAIVFFAAFNEAIIASNIIQTLCKIIKLDCYTQYVTSFIMSFFEITGGVSSFAKAIFDKKLFMIISSCMCGFAGISIHIQIAGIYSKYNLPTKFYFVGKIMHAATAAAVAACII